MGCFFHFCQAVYRQIQQLGLQQTYANDEQFRLLCRKLMALALMPLDKVLTSFEEIQRDALTSYRGTIDRLLSYFEDNWMSEIDLWNVSGSDSRTNNTCEGERKR